jgi:hypothetical protein
MGKWISECAALVALSLCAAVSAESPSPTVFAALTLWTIDGDTGNLPPVEFSPGQFPEAPLNVH